MYYINNRFVSAEEATISILDLTVLRGFGVFDYLRTYKGKPFHLHEHLLRLHYSAHQLGLSLTHTFAQIEEIIYTLLEKNTLPEASIKILLTGGISPDQFTPNNRENLIIFTYPLSPYPEKYYTDGIRVITTRLNRSLPTSKTTQYTAGIVAMQKGKDLQPQEALYLNADNEILEATTSNFFGFKQGILYTCCSEEVLIGITREIVRRLAASHFPIETRALRYEEIPELEEAFITASNKEVMPVTQIDTHSIGNGHVGPQTQQIMHLFRNYTEQAEWPPLIIPRYRLAIDHREILSH